MKYVVQTLKWLALGLVDLVFNLFCVLFLNWWVVFVARPVKPEEWMYSQAKPEWQGLEQRLPNWLKWVETFDASLDTGWIGGYFVPKGTYSKDNLPSFWRRKYYQWRWLNRNSGYGFSYYPLGEVMDQKKWTIQTWQPFDGKHQLFIATATNGLWNINYQGKYGTYKLGWKAWNYWDRDQLKWYSDTKPWGPEWRVPVVMSINPFNRKK
ncbi:hypothetical protein [Achromobacter phage Motura]|uniref:Uncharacterized protein n=1 Tax=Achromobacter phage Motura TaxID=2591403 RepID=A0A514CT08_9CAUD|nr:hypothetical protein H1O15_gp169 [Achromobacter phage Motura]QDH83619.1 hypothetical protein [Achromobacter phage Motura]